MTIPPEILAEPFNNSAIYNWLQRVGPADLARKVWGLMRGYQDQLRGTVSSSELKVMAWRRTFAELATWPEPPAKVSKRKAATKKKPAMKKAAQAKVVAAVEPEVAEAIVIEPAVPAKSAFDQEMEALRRAQVEERERLAVAKERLARESFGAKGTLAKQVQWAIKWQPIAKGEGVIRWDRVEEQPPGPGAVALLEEACRDFAGFCTKFQKSMAVAGGLDEETLERERKREDELLKRLDELEAEIAAQGEEAYA